MYRNSYRCSMRRREGKQRIIHRLRWWYSNIAALTDLPCIMSSLSMTPLILCCGDSSEMVQQQSNSVWQGKQLDNEVPDRGSTPTTYAGNILHPFMWACEAQTLTA